ncbi:DoxX family membrane protein [Chryseobacterium shigense]|uniref:Putative membrane protein YphA (DoxX/SURF4 family) n=1 Tax=Chryseobacterium shigense TaxID=297244 RepID=A0A841NBT1_9FLAO|nr:DoxX family membrane protein [Chryseobacterium shigense]MBB6372483.1 putative membrane protein YphA (DoxX/SURF4 family) [Chryseobacterium shigense]
MTFQKLRTNRWNHWIIIHVRYLVGFAFFPSGLTKLAGNRFTSISTDTPIGYFFEAMYRTGFYWNFLGLCQITAGILLMTQRYALLGALMFLAILSNIWIITISLSFTGTWVITSLMMVAVITLLVWDYYKLAPIFSYNRSMTIPSYPDPDRMWINAGIIYTACLMGLSLPGPVHKDWGQWISRILVLAVFLTFLVSNYKMYKKRSLLLKNQV